MAARRACDSVARAGGSEGSLDRARPPNVELEAPTLGCGKSRGAKAESKSGGRQRDAHEPIVTWVARVGQCSGMTPE